MRDTPPKFFELKLTTRYGNVEGRLAIPTQPMRLSELVLAAYQLEMQLQRLSITASTKTGKRITCGPKCGACCRQAVPISAPEAFLIAETVSRMPVTMREKVLGRFAEAKAALQTAGFGDRSLDAAANRDAILNLGLDYFRLGIACPFLVDESCSIHENRPTSCREFLVTSNPTLCAHPEDDRIEGIEPAFSVTEALAHIAAMLFDGEPELMPLTLALDFAVEHVEASRARYDASELLGAFFDVARQLAEGPATETGLEEQAGQ